MCSRSKYTQHPQWNKYNLKYLMENRQNACRVPSSALWCHMFLHSLGVDFRSASHSIWMLSERSSTYMYIMQQNKKSYTRKRPKFGFIFGIAHRLRSAVYNCHTYIIVAAVTANGINVTLVVSSENVFEGLFWCMRMYSLCFPLDNMFVMRRG